MNKFNEIHDAIQYIKYHAMQANCQYREPDNFRKITELRDLVYALEASIETIDGIGGFRFK